MNRQEYDERYEETKKYHNGALMALDISNIYIDSLEQRIKELEHTIKQDNNLITSELHKIEELQSTIEAQEIIIKDMAQHTSCEGREWSFSGMNSKCEGCRQTTVVKLSNYQAKAQP